MKPIVFYESKGPTGNVFALLGFVKNALEREGDFTGPDECANRVFAESNSYEETLAIIGEYVDLIDTSEEE